MRAQSTHLIQLYPCARLSHGDDSLISETSNCSPFVSFDVLSISEGNVCETIKIENRYHFFLKRFCAKNTKTCFPMSNQALLHVRTGYFNSLQTAKCSRPLNRNAQATFSTNVEWNCLTYVIQQLLSEGNGEEVRSVGRKRLYMTQIRLASNNSFFRLVPIPPIADTKTFVAACTPASPIFSEYLLRTSLVNTSTITSEDSLNRQCLFCPEQKDNASVATCRPSL